MAATCRFGVVNEGLIDTQGCNVLLDNTSKGRATTLGMLGDMLAEIHLDRNTRNNVKRINSVLTPWQR